MDAAVDASWQALQTDAESLQNISSALSATLDPRVPNEVRQQALQHLEHVKTTSNAPHLGFMLAEDWKQNEAVRYYGLQLLEYAVRYSWADYSLNQAEQLRDWVKRLAGSLREQDVLYIRNKVAQLWVEVAKRCWGDEWMDMDKLLVTLWDTPMSEKGTVNKIMVLYVLETLSEDVIHSEDAVAGLRLDVLGHALNEIIIPQGLYYKLVETRGGCQEVRHGDEGWAARVCGFFATCVKQSALEQSLEARQSLTLCAVKCLRALRPTLAWINLKAAVEISAVECLFLPFHTDDIALCTVATEVLYALLNRPYGQHIHDTWMDLFVAALHADRVSLLRRAFDNSLTSPGEDDEKYTLGKKLSETLSVLADAIASHPELAAKDHTIDLPAFFDLLQQALQSRSLTVSIPIVHSFTKLMAVQDVTVKELVFRTFMALMQTCSERLIRYEALNEDSEDHTVQFLLEDFETMPERHAFLGNYRRYCVSIIQSVTRMRPLDALSYVLNSMMTMLENGRYTAARGFKSETYSKNDLSVLQFDAQYQVVASALRGYSAWLADMSNVTQEDELHIQSQSDKAETSNFLQNWCYNVIKTHTNDPEVAAQVLQTMVAILRTINPEPAFVLQVVQHLLTMRLYDNPTHTIFSESVKSFEGLRVVELQKLALVFSNELLEVYHELEPRIGVLSQKHNDDPRLAWGYRAFLFMIIHRASGIDNESRMSRLQAMLQPICNAWQAPELSESLADLGTFCASLGLGSLADFYRENRFDQVENWSEMQLDSAGQARQSEIKARGDELPLRMTKAMLAATTEKIWAGTDEFELACALWSGIIPLVLPNLLKMLRQAQAFHNMENWAQLPHEHQAVVKRTLQDRFWQSGISSESKTEFYARISGSRTSYEGFASVVRGTMRNIREQGYHILYLMTKFDEQFYGLSSLAVPLAEALFADAGALSANHLQPIISLSTGMVQHCPPHHRAHFLPPMLRQLFLKFDAKISGEWESIERVSESTGEDEQALGDEMRTESVLRQLTYSTVSFVAFLLEFDAPEQLHTNGRHHSPTRQRPPPSSAALGKLIMSDVSVLEPLVLFCTHALRMRDTRCCVAICKVLRRMVPQFETDNTAEGAQVREFMSTEVLKACITSLHEPYFADMQKDLAMLIAQILLLYTPTTTTPREVLLSLPEMSATKIDRALGKMYKTQNERQQRSLVLDLLDGVRGKSIHEQGKIFKETKKAAKTIEQQYMETEQAPRIVLNGDESVLDGVSGLFETT